MHQSHLYSAIQIAFDKTDIIEGIVKCQIPKMDNKDLPINPCRIDNIGFGELQYTGLTKREYFAAIALNGTLADGDGDYNSNAKYAVEWADALIKEL